MAVVETYIKPEGLRAVEQRIDQEAKARAGTSTTDLVLVNAPVEVPENIQKLTELGFTAQAKWRMKGAIQEWGATTLFPELTGDEFTQWRLFLPTSYRELEKYNYDVIPDEAIDAIHQAKQFDCFDRVEIWTDEANTARSVLTRGLIAEAEAAKDRAVARRERWANWDPMAVGVLVNHDGVERYFAITRWGQEKLMSLKQVTRHNASLAWRGHAFTFAPAVALVALVAFMVHSYNALPGLTIPLAVVLVALTVAANVIWRTGLNEYHKVLLPRKGGSAGARYGDTYVDGSRVTNRN